MKCLDTDLLVAILRGKREVCQIVEELDWESKGVTTVINVFELFFGASKSDRRNENVAEVQTLLEKLEILPLDNFSAKKAGEIFADLAIKGQVMDFRDAMIAGIVIENNLTLITRNIAHFSRVKNLSVETW
ncbi:MAG: type II toxin-antitoxin system VapC family toxin [Nitrososphaerota archaeon]|nr:type II toxin-antitoxin system VapC family toxin [Nitrososphaerota archaeon]